MMSSGTNTPFGESDPNFLGRFRYAVAGFLKHLIIARGQQEPEFISAEMRQRWNLDEIASETISCEHLLRTATQQLKRILDEYVGYQDSIPAPESEDDERLEKLRENVASFVESADLDAAIKQLRQGKKVNWPRLATWDLLPAIRDALDRLPEPARSTGPSEDESRAAGRRPPRRPNDRAPESLGPVEAEILRALAANAPVTMIQVQIEAQLHISKRTISGRLKRLRELGLVIRPNGPRGGETITDKGRACLPLSDSSA